MRVSNPIVINVCVEQINFNGPAFNGLKFNQGKAGGKLFPAAAAQLLEELADVMLKEYDTKSLRALPPWAQQAREEKAIVELLKELGEDDGPITIYKGEDGIYHVKCGDRSIDVKVVYEPREDGLVGPAKFHLEVLKSEGKGA